MSYILGNTPKLVSDGKRMREIWKSSDGNGNDNAGLIERSINILRGHPTWKLFMGEVLTTIERGTQDEPPHYCYLDDHACHAVLTSKAYTNEELNEFWPFDFNQRGVVKQGRKNRGRPVFLNDSRTDFAKAPMRSKKMLYIFSGEPQFTRYAPLRPKRKTNMEKQVEGELAEDIAAARSQAVVETPKNTLVTTSEAAKKYSEAVIKGHATGRYPALPRVKINHSHSSRPTETAPGNQGACTTTSKKEKAEPINPQFPAYGPKPVSLPPRCALPSPIGKLTRGAPTNLTKSGFSPEMATQSSFKELRKRRVSSADAVISKSADRPPRASIINLDGANDDGMDTNRMENKSEREGFSAVSSFLREASPEARLEQMQWDLDAAHERIKAIERREDHLQKVIIILLAGRSAQEVELANRIIALQKLANLALAFKDGFQKLSDTATGEIQPTSALVQSIGCVLDEPARYMYENGMDELWADLNERSRN